MATQEIPFSVTSVTRQIALAMEERQFYLPNEERRISVPREGEERQSYVLSAGGRVIVSNEERQSGVSREERQVNQASEERRVNVASEARQSGVLREEIQANKSSEERPGGMANEERQIIVTREEREEREERPVEERQIILAREEREEREERPVEVVRDERQVVTLASENTQITVASVANVERNVSTISLVRQVYAGTEDPPIDVESLLRGTSSPTSLETNIFERILDLCKQHSKSATSQSLLTRARKFYNKFWASRGIPNAEITPDGVLLFLIKRSKKGSMTLNNYYKGLIHLHKLQCDELHTDYKSLREDKRISMLMRAVLKGEVFQIPGEQSGDEGREENRSIRPAMLAPDDAEFSTKEELILFVKNFGGEQGYAVSIRRSTQKRVDFKCDRGGQYENKRLNEENRKRKSRTNKIGCPFDLRAHYREGKWFLRTVISSHNHPSNKDFPGSVDGFVDLDNLLRGAREPPPLDPDFFQKVLDLCLDRKPPSTQSVYIRASKYYTEYWASKGIPNAAITADGALIFLARRLKKGLITLRNYLRGLADLHEHQCTEQKIVFISLKDDPRIETFMNAVKRGTADDSKMPVEEEPNEEEEAEDALLPVPPGEKEPLAMLAPNDCKLPTREDVISYVKAFGEDQGYAVAIRRSTLNRIDFKCDRGGIYVNEKLTDETRKRKSKTVRIGCPFDIRANFRGGKWFLRTVNPDHNHPASLDMSGNAIARRFTPGDMKKLEALTLAGAAPRDILRVLQTEGEKKHYIPRDIYNARRKVLKIHNPTGENEIENRGEIENRLEIEYRIENRAEIENRGENGNRGEIENRGENKNRGGNENRGEIKHRGENGNRGEVENRREIQYRIENLGETDNRAEKENQGEIENRQENGHHREIENHRDIGTQVVNDNRLENENQVDLNL